MLACSNCLEKQISVQRKRTRRQNRSEGVRSMSENVRRTSNEIERKPRELRDG